MVDVLIAGAGPAGSVAGLVLARAGARVVIVDRCEFPREAVCGGVLTPRAVAQLKSLGLHGGPLDTARRITRTSVWSNGRHATRVGERLAIARGAFDAWLLECAVAAGAKFEPRQRVRAPLVDSAAGHRDLVRGVVLAGRRHSIRMPALVTIAADGRHSALARAAGLIPARRDCSQRAFCVSVRSATGLADDRLEIHAARGAWVGLTPLTGGEARLWVVTASPERGPAERAIRAALHGAGMADRFAKVELDAPRRVRLRAAAFGEAVGLPGLLVAGDAAHAAVPIANVDGVADAMVGGLLAAREALQMLQSGDFPGGVTRLMRARREALGRPPVRSLLLRGPLGLALADWTMRASPSAALHLILGRPRL